MGHYYQGMTHYEYTTKFLKPHLTKMRKTLDVCGWDPLVAIHKVYEEAQTNNRQKQMTCCSPEASTPCST